MKDRETNVRRMEMNYTICTCLNFLSIVDHSSTDEKQIFLLSFFFFFCYTASIFNSKIFCEIIVKKKNEKVILIGFCYTQCSQT